MVPEGGVLDGVLSSQRDAAEQDEEEDEVGEDRVVDDAVALQAEPTWEGGREKHVRKDEYPSGLRSLAPLGPNTQAGRLQYCLAYGVLV